MKRVLEQLPLVAALILLATVLGPSMHAQQADQDPSPTAPAKTNPALPQAQQNEAQMPASGEATTRDAKTFTGRIMKEDGQIVLKDPVTKVTYKLDDAAKAKQYLGKQVKATGKLDMNTNTIQLERVEPIS
jgi:cytoskeletal protein RodZ